MLGKGRTENFEDSFAGTNPSSSAWVSFDVKIFRIKQYLNIKAIAIYNGMWSYDGWNQLNFASEELKNPGKNFPIVIIAGMSLVTVCYILTNIAYFSVMTPSEARF